MKLVKGKKDPKRRGPAPRLYTFKVTLDGGPVTERYVTKNPEVWRTIGILGEQSLEDLHRAIFRAFDREEEHMYQFTISAKGVRDRAAPKFVGPAEAETGEVDPAGVTIASLKLRTGQVIWYRFDFGDDWMHKLVLTSVDDEVPRGRYPKVLDRMGANPPQYVDWDE